MSSVLEHTSKLPTGSDDAIPDDPAGRLYRLSVDQYHEMARAGVFAEDQRVELLEGLLVRKMTKNPPHVISLKRLVKLLSALLADNWHLATQDPLSLDRSEPEPDLTLIRGSEDDYREHHPGPADCGLIVEVSDSTLRTDRDDKKTIYARNGITEYWIVNLIERQIEVYSQPSGLAEFPDYGSREDYKPGDVVPVNLDRTETGTISVDDVLP